MTSNKFPLSTIAELSTLVGIEERDLWAIARTTVTSYARWQEPKGSGGFRSLTSPKAKLKDLQKKLHKLIFSKMTFGTFSHYGLKKKSNITNAHEHCGNNVIFKFDIKSFFPSVRPERVSRALVDELGCPEPLADLITKLVTVDYQLPQGAPTSTDIANIVTMRMQRRLNPLARQWGIKKFTILGDDVTFSADAMPEGFIRRVERIVKAEGFKIHSYTKKGGVFNKSQAQTITGINIAHGPTAGKRKKIWRAEIHQAEVRFKNGEIDQQAFDRMKKTFEGRMGYAKSVARPKSKHRADGGAHIDNHTIKSSK